MDGKIRQNIYKIIERKLVKKNMETTINNFFFKFVGNMWEL